MKKPCNIMIWGSNLFLDLHLSDQTNKIVLSSTWAIKLKSKFNVDNFSMKLLDTDKALNYMLKILKQDTIYEKAIIELGTYDLVKICKGLDTVDSFKQNIFQIISVLRYSNIEPVLFTISPIIPELFKKKYDISISEEEVKLTHKRINRIIKEMCNEYSIKLIDDNKAITKNKNIYMNDDGITLNGYGNELIKNMIHRKIV